MSDYTNSTNRYLTFRNLILTGELREPNGDRKTLVNGQKPPYLFPGTRGATPRLKANCDLDNAKHSLNVDVPFNVLSTFNEILKESLDSDGPFKRKLILKGGVFEAGQYVGEEKKGRMEVIRTKTEVTLEIETASGVIMYFTFGLRRAEMEGVSGLLIQSAYCKAFFNSWVTSVEKVATMVSIDESKITKY